MFNFSSIQYILCNGWYMYEILKPIFIYRFLRLTDKNSCVSGVIYTENKFK